MYKHHLSLTSQQDDSQHKHAAHTFQGLSQIGRFSAANQGPYNVIGYQHNSCNGTIALVPLYRNAEGAAILSRLIQQKDIRKGVILAGEIHPQFPQLTYTLWQIEQSFKRLFNHNFSQAPLFAFAETGHCQLAEKVVNITL